MAGTVLHSLIYLLLGLSVEAGPAGGQGLGHFLDHCGVSYWKPLQSSFRLPLWQITSNICANWLCLIFSMFPAKLILDNTGCKSWGACFSLAQSVSVRLLNGSRQQMQLYSVNLLQLSKLSSSSPPDHQGYCLSWISKNQQTDRHMGPIIIRRASKHICQPSDAATVPHVLQNCGVWLQWSVFVVWSINVSLWNMIS